MRIVMRSAQSRLVRSIILGALAGCGLPGGQQRGRAGTSPMPPLAGLDLLVPVPESNPLTAAAVALGERLFFDPGLSADGVMRCASCHRPEYAFSASRPLP